MSNNNNYDDNKNTVELGFFVEDSAAVKLTHQSKSTHLKIEIKCNITNRI